MVANRQAMIEFRINGEQTEEDSLTWYFTGMESIYFVVPGLLCARTCIYLMKIDSTHK